MGIQSRSNGERFDVFYNACDVASSDALDRDPMATTLMGSEVNNFLKFWSKHQMQWKNIESDIQNTKPPRTDDPII